MPPQVAKVTIPIDQRSDAQLTISRSGELYGCILNLYIKVTAAGSVFRVPDEQGNTLVEFVQPTVQRTVPAAQLKKAGVVAIDVIVTLKQPSALTGNVQLQAKLDMAGVPSSSVSDTLQLEAGDETGVLDVGWGISA